MKDLLEKLKDISESGRSTLTVERRLSWVELSDITCRRRMSISDEDGFYYATLVNPKAITITRITCETADEMIFVVKALFRVHQDIW